VARYNDRTGKPEVAPPAAPPPAPAPAPAPASAPPAGGPAGRFAKPEVGGRGAGIKGTAARLDHVEVTCPALVAFLADSSWADGTFRIPGTMIVFVESGQWKACLTCRSTFRKAFLSASTLQELLSRADVGLDTDDLDWRKDGGAKRS